MDWQAEMEALIDRYFDGRVKKRDVPGVALSVVKDGQTLVTGYSYADREKREVVRADRDVFYVGSLSRLFTTIAILQLYERGSLNLSDEVNRHLGAFSVPGGHPPAIAHLLTHTDGFEERNKAIYALRASDVPPLKRVIEEGLKAPVIEPGKAISYGAWGMALAGYIVEQITGMSFADYAEQNILKPLGMESSTFQRRIPDATGERFAKKYYYQFDTLRLAPFIYSTAPPFGGLVTTTADMVCLMKALLERDKRILKDSTILEMFGQRFTMREDLPGVTYGFMEYWENGQRGLVCDGDGMGVRSRLLLMPEYHTGLFIVTNADGHDICEGLAGEYVRHFYPVDMPPLQPPAHFTHRGDRFVGVYQYIQHVRHSYTKVGALFEGIVQVVNNKNGTLTVTPGVECDPRGGFEGPTVVTISDPSLLFQRNDTRGRVAFQEDAGGLITQLHSGSGYQSTFKKLALYETPRFIFALIGVCLIAFASGLVWSLGVIGVSPTVANGSAWVSALLGGLTSLTNLVFAGGVLFFILRRIAGMPIYHYAREIPRWVKWLFGLSLANALLAFALFICALIALTYQFWSGGERLHFLGVTAAAMAFTWLAARLNLFWARF